MLHGRRKRQPTPVFLPGESRGQRSLVGCCPWGCTESDMTEVTCSSSSSSRVLHSVDIPYFIQPVPFCSGYQYCINMTLKLSHVKYHFSALSLWVRNSDRAQWGCLVSDTWCLGPQPGRTKNWSDSVTGEWDHQ